MILVVAEQRAGTVNRGTWEAIAAAQQIAGNEPISVVVLAASAATAAAALAAAAVQDVVAVDDEALASYTPDGVTAALQQVIAALEPSLVLLSHTYQARDFAPTLAARLDRALVTDVVSINASENGRVFMRPMFQGKLVADVRPEGPVPHIVTIQAGAFRPDQAVKGAVPVTVRSFSVTLDPATIRTRPEAPFQEAKQSVDLSQAPRIVAVGRGIKSQDQLPLAQKLADACGAELAASRPICDAGWLPMDRQVGSSGQTVAPALYLALGISGAIQHLVGMKGSRTIVAINKDPDAPIFEVADYGIVGDLFEIVPALLEALRE